MPLTPTDRALLDIESRSWRFKGAKESAVREATGLPFEVGMQRLVHLIDEPAALEYAPVTCRLIRQRLGRRRGRSLAS